MKKFYVNRSQYEEIYFAFKQQFVIDDSLPSAKDYLRPYYRRVVIDDSKSTYSMAIGNSEIPLDNCTIAEDQILPKRKVFIFGQAFIVWVDGSSDENC